MATRRELIISIELPFVSIWLNPLRLIVSDPDLDLDAVKQVIDHLNLVRGPRVAPDRNERYYGGTLIGTKFDVHARLPPSALPR